MDLLTLEPIEENLFRGRSQDLGFRQLFGGQVLGQSLSAASQTVEEARHVHSLHGYFLRPGDAALPVVYSVDRVRDGGSFSTRRVTAIQKGHPIFTCTTSFQYDEEGFEHQTTMPVVVGPENLPSELELTQQRAHLIPEHMRDKLLCPKPIEVRPVTEKTRSTRSRPTRSSTCGFVPTARWPTHQRCINTCWPTLRTLACSTTSLLPHGKTVWQKDMQVASLDHALWFHADLRADDWLLYAMDSPWAGNSRGFSRGSVYNRAGQLVASVTQEGLIRHRKDWA